MSRSPFRHPTFCRSKIFGRTNVAYRWAGETDVFESAFESACKNYAVDENRITLRGFSMGGSGTWHLGLQHPDRWAAIEPGAGFNDTQHYGHMPNLPAYELKALHIYDSKDYALELLSTSHEKRLYRRKSMAMTSRISPTFARSWPNRESHFEPAGLNWVTNDVPMIMIVGPKTPHAWEPDSRKRCNAFMDAAAKKGRIEPDHIRFVTYTMRYNRCFWVMVDGLEQHYERAEGGRHAFPDSRRNDTSTHQENVNMLVLNATDVKKIEIDGQSIASSGANDLRLTKRGPEYGRKAATTAAFANATACRAPSTMHLWILSCAFVRRAALPTILPAAMRRRPWIASPTILRNISAARSESKTIPEVTPADMEQSHLIVFGDPQSNQILNRMVGKLPVSWDARQLSLGRKTFDAAHHTLVMVYPNPLEARRYVVLNSGHSFHANELAATNATLFPRFGDYAVLRLRQPIATPVESEVLTAGYFDEEWKLPEA